MQLAGFCITGDEEDLAHVPVELGQVSHMVPMLIQSAVTIQPVDYESAGVKPV